MLVMGTLDVVVLVSLFNKYVKHVYILPYLLLYINHIHDMANEISPAKHSPYSQAESSQSNTVVIGRI